jgi:hypothetical protein
MNTTKDLPPTILMSREGSSMASTWTEHLCVSCLDGKWLIGEYGYNWAASIDDIPEEERYTEDGELKIPEEWNGHKVLGIADGEYIETDELVERVNYIEFLSSDIHTAVKFGIEFGWRKYQEFPIAMEKLRAIVYEFSSVDVYARNNALAPKAILLPKELWEIRDAAIESLLSNSPLPEGIADLQKWLATEGWDELLAAWINEDVALNLKEWAFYKLSDSSLCDDEGLDESKAINDQMRVDYARATIRYAVEESEGYFSPSVHSLLIERDDGKRALLGCTVEIHGQAGPVPQWHGIFVDKKAFYVYLRNTGFLIHSIADEISDADILSFWVVEKKKKKKTSK